MHFTSMTRLFRVKMLNKKYLKRQNKVGASKLENICFENIKNRDVMNDKYS